MNVPSELQGLSLEKQRFYIFLTHYCGFAFKKRYKRGKHYYLNFTYPDNHDTDILYVVRQSEFSPHRQWLRVIDITGGSLGDVGSPLFDHFNEILNSGVDEILEASS